MDIVIALFVLACVFVAVPGPWAWFASFWAAIYFLSEAVAYFGGQL